MGIIVNLDVVMAMRKISCGELAEKIGITNANLSILKTGKAKAIRFSTLSKLCQVLQCQPGDILEYTDNDGEDIVVAEEELPEGGSSQVKIYTPKVHNSSDKITKRRIKYEQQY